MKAAKAELERPETERRIAAAQAEVVAATAKLEAVKSELPTSADSVL